MEGSRPASSKPRARAGTPFLMPDGRPLGLFLAENNLAHDKPASRKGKRRPGTLKGSGSKHGWTSKSGGAAMRAAASQPAADGYRSDAEQMELDALNRVGQRRRRRWLNDKLLRDMAGKLTAHDMEALFKPVPFGETGHASLFSRAASPDYVQVWDLFRSVDMDKESRVLQKWEAHVRELQRGPHAIDSPAIHALAAWSAVSWKARKAMKRASLALVEGLEAQLLAFLAGGSGGKGEAGVGELVLEPEDSFGRLISHGLAEFHGLASHSRLDADGVKRVVLRHRKGAAAAGSAGPSDQPAISCSDILMLLEDAPQHGLNSRVLSEAFCHGLDSSSDAGGAAVEQALAPQLAQMTMVAVQ